MREYTTGNRIVDASAEISITGNITPQAWYKTIVVNLKRFAENDERKYLQLLETPFASAELLLGNNSAKALDFLCQVE